MRRARGIGTVLVAGALLLAGCVAEPSVRVTGKILDAETGEPVPRNRIFVHAFNDATGHQVSLRPNGKTEFELRMPAPEIRLRISDLAYAYELFEEDFVAVDGELHVDVRLQPTHRIRLYGTVLWRDPSGTLRPLSEGDGNVRKASLSAADHVGFSTDEAGNFSVLAPRKMIRVMSINTNYRHEPTEVDLRGVEGDEYELHLVLSPPR